MVNRGEQLGYRTNSVEQTTRDVADHSSYGLVETPLTLSVRLPREAGGPGLALTHCCNARCDPVNVRLVIVAHTERGERIRIISARELTRAEREAYEEETKK